MQLQMQMQSVGLGIWVQLVGFFSSTLAIAVECDGDVGGFLEKMGHMVLCEEGRGGFVNREHSLKRPALVMR